MPLYIYEKGLEIKKWSKWRSTCVRKWM